MSTSIQWTSRTWNPVTGCDLLSPGCDHCYAKTMSRRLMLMGQAKYANNFTVTLHPECVDIPRTWEKPSTVFVNSMSDLFHHEVPLEFIQKCFKVMRETQHVYQILTKRSGRLLAYSDKIDWPENVWMGVSVEAPKYQNRIQHLLKTGAKLKFASLEPMLESPSDINLRGLDWAILGGESGAGARPFDVRWVDSFLANCAYGFVAPFVKQFGSNVVSMKLKDNKGGDMEEWPEWARIREMPNKKRSGF